ncbi:MAG: acyl-ACP--UDP-N-acetylglucosamine O-acyltransferase [Acidobacteriota bacterium]|nr:MAG: acyl-ACP--UDP-N-acetylglucosamine O-acyltransferase [Acidobacteriota bacterium]
MSRSHPDTAIHPTAIVHPEATLEEGVRIGPYCVVDENVRIGARTRLEAGVRIWPFTTIGSDCHFFPTSSIGSVPQDLKFQGEESRLVIGDRNVVREFCTFNRGTKGGGGTTRIGNDNFFMAYAHVAHDCQIGDHTVFANAATLAGHVLVEDHAVIGAFTGIHQFCRVGKHAFIGGASAIPLDPLPFVRTAGNRARAYGINTIGLERKGFSKEAIEKLKDAYRILFHTGRNTAQAIEAVRADIKGCEEVEYLVRFIETSERGIVKG